MTAHCTAGVPTAFDALGKALASLDDPANHVQVVRTAGAIQRAKPGDTGLSGDCINETHPDAHGYALLAQRINGTLAGNGIA